MHIIANITSLIQYIKTLKNAPRFLPLESCPCCGKASPWRHGFYPRKANRGREPSEPPNPILIQRFFCPDCGKTSSVLPECIPARRWYLWDIQQAVLLLLLMGKSLNATAKEVMPSRHTIKRWLTGLKKQFPLHKDVLCRHFAGLGRAVDYIDFWKIFFKDNLLSAAMRLCHVTGVLIP